MHDRDWANARSSGITKRIATAVTDGPKSESEFVFWFWLERLACHFLIPCFEYQKACATRESMNPGFKTQGLVFQRV